MMPLLALTMGPALAGTLTVHGNLSASGETGIYGCPDPSAPCSSAVATADLTPYVTLGPEYQPYTPKVTAIPPGVALVTVDDTLIGWLDKHRKLHLLHGITLGADASASVAAEIKNDRETRHVN